MCCGLSGTVSLGTSGSPSPSRIVSVFAIGEREEGKLTKREGEREGHQVRTGRDWSVAATAKGRSRLLAVPRS